MEEILQKKWTYREFRELEFDDNDPFWYELINGELVQKQSPSVQHQRIARKLERALDNYAERTQSGEMFHAPLDVVLDDYNAYHPDILFIKKDRSHIIDPAEQIIIGAPDLVIEILSKSTAPFDKGVKKDNYERNGVREYWLVDPKSKTIEVYSLVNQRYTLVAYQEETGKILSAILEGFEIEIETIFE